MDKWAGVSNTYKFVIDNTSPYFDTLDIDVTPYLRGLVRPPRIASKAS